MAANTNILMQLLNVLRVGDGEQRRVATPEGCKTCLYNQPEWKDVPGAHCYMFREMPPGSCAQWRRAD